MRSLLLVLSAVVGTLVILLVAQAWIVPVRPTPARPTPEVTRSQELDELRRAVTELRFEIARARGAPAQIEVAPAVQPLPPVLDDDLQGRRERARDRVAAAEARHTWTHADSVALLGELAPLPPEERRLVMARVTAAVTAGRMRPEMLPANQGATR